jgi:hypothetical protein
MKSLFFFMNFADSCKDFENLLKNKKSGMDLNFI